jgi:hypothetical protein
MEPIFLHDDALSTVDLVDLIHLLAKMITYSGAYVTDDLSCEHEHATRALPDIINKFVSISHKDSGERMRKRTFRHALDSKTLPLDCGRVGEIFRYGNTLGLKIVHEIAPSYQTDQYDTVTAFTAEDLLACSDTCKAVPDCDFFGAGNPLSCHRC